MKEYTSFSKQKRNQATKELEKHFIRFMKTAFYAKTKKIERHRVKKFNEKDNGENTFEKLSKLAFNRTDKFITSYESYTFRQKEILMKKPIYLGQAVLDLCQLLMYETLYDKLTPFFGETNI